MKIENKFNGDCAKGIHWYVGYYSNGFWIYNKCAYCKQIQTIAQL